MGFRASLGGSYIGFRATRLHVFRSSVLWLRQRIAAWLKPGRRFRRGQVRCARNVPGHGRACRQHSCRPAKLHDQLVAGVVKSTLSSSESGILWGGLGRGWGEGLGGGGLGGVGGGWGGLGGGYLQRCRQCVQHTAQGCGTRHVVTSVHAFCDHAQNTGTYSIFATLYNRLHKDVEQEKHSQASLPLATMPKTLVFTVFFFLYGLQT